MINALKTRQWPTVFGYLLFIGMMAAGYYYNLTFVQIGLEDLGTRILRLDAAVVARDMAVLALLTCLSALASGYVMQRRGWGRQFHIKLRLAWGVLLAQTLLTLISPQVGNETQFIAWLAGTSFALGVGIPVMFSMVVDLVPVNSRGYAAALITAVAYFAAEVFSSSWTFDAFYRQSLALMVFGTAGLGVLVIIRHPWKGTLASQHTRPEFAAGRLVPRNSPGKGRISRRMVGMIVIMFGIYFVDSLGFLRLLNTPLYMESSWQSSVLNNRLFIAGVHVVGALSAGVLYSALKLRSLFTWVFGLFALTHLQYSFHIQVAGSPAVLSMPMLYALAVSLYTVLNFALWADLSTPDTISVNAALGVALSAWTATFLSTALAIRWQDNMLLARHIQIVDSIAMLFFVTMLLLVLWGPISRKRPS